MSDFIQLVSAEGIEPGSLTPATIDGHEFMVARVGDDYLVADARCPHLRGHLVKGTLEGTVLTCPLHHSQFDLTDGHVVRWTDWTGAVLSVSEIVRHPRPLRVYECKVEGGSVWVGPQKPPADVPAES